MIKADYQTSGPAVSPVRQSGRRQVERRLAAVLAADIAGYSAMMGGDEEATHRRVGTGFGRVFKEIERYRGRVFTFAGDGIMAEFPSAVNAVRCAIEIQRSMIDRNAKIPEDKRMSFRVGLTLAT